jgi:hypothetical protein
MLDCRVFKFEYIFKFDVCKLEIRDSIVFILTPFSKISLPFIKVIYDRLPSVASEVESVANSFENLVKLEKMFPDTNKFPTSIISPINVFPT